MTKTKLLRFLKFIIGKATSEDIEDTIIDIESVIENYKREKMGR